MHKKLNTVITFSIAFMMMLFMSFSTTAAFAEPTADEDGADVNATQVLPDSDKYSEGPEVDVDVTEPDASPASNQGNKDKFNTEENLGAGTFDLEFYTLITDDEGTDWGYEDIANGGKLELNEFPIWDDEYYECLEFTADYDIKNVTFDDPSVFKCEKDLDDPEYFYLTPLKAGTATLVATAKNGRTSTVTITMTQKFVDEFKYKIALYEACAPLYFGDTIMTFYLESENGDSFADTSINVSIGGDDYPVGQYEREGSLYIFTASGIPNNLEVGTPINVTLTKGEATYVYNSSVKKGNLYRKGYAYLDKYSYVYSGKTIKPSYTFEYWINDWTEEKPLTKGTDYTVTYENNKNVGTAKIKFTGIGDYGSTYTEKFKIIPKGTSISGFSKYKKAFKVKWKKQSAKMSTSRITGYQIRYSTNSSMSSAKKVKVKGYKTVSKKITKLKAKKKYYVQVRTYKVVNGSTYYSNWSKKSSVKTK